MGEKRVTWDELIAESGYRSPAPVNEFVKLANAAHHYRYTHDAADRDEINRSSALWALMTVDKEVRTALGDCGLDGMRMQHIIGLRGFSLEGNVEDVGVPYIDMMFAESIRAYLRTRTSPGDMTRKEVAIAVLQSVRLQRGLVLDQPSEPLRSGEVLCAPRFLPSRHGTCRALQQEPSA